MGRLDVFDAVPALREERAALLTLLRSVGDDAWDRATECPGWSVKGVVLHLICDDLSLLSRQRDRAVNSLDIRARTHPADRFVQLLNGFNDEWVELTEFFSPALVVDLLAVTGDWTAGFYSSVDPMAPGEPMHWGEPDAAPFWRLAAREYTERWIHHLQIASAVGSGEPLAPSLVVPAFEATLQAIRHTLLVMPGAERAIAATLVELGRSWTLQGDDEGWHLSVGASDEATVAIEFQTATFGDLLARRLTRPQIAAIPIYGDPSFVPIVASLLGTFAVTGP